MKNQEVEDFDAIVYPDKNWRLGTVSILVNKGKYFEFSFFCGIPEIKEKVIAEWGDKVEVFSSYSIAGIKANLKHVVHVLNKYGFTVKTKHDWV